MTVGSVVSEPNKVQVLYHVIYARAIPAPR